MRVNPKSTDVELFSALELGDDMWQDAGLFEAYAYLRRGTRGSVPNSWELAMDQLDSDLLEKGFHI